MSIQNAASLTTRVLATVLVGSLAVSPVRAQMTVTDRLGDLTLEKAADTESSLVPDAATFENPFGDTALQKSEPDPQLNLGEDPEDDPPFNEQEALDTEIRYGSDDPSLHKADGFDPDGITADQDDGSSGLHLAEGADTVFESAPPELTPGLTARFVRGDTDSSGALNGTDLVVLAERIGAIDNRVSCDKAADLNDDGALTSADLPLLANLITLGTPQPPAPFPACGIDRTIDGLSCHAGCP